MGILPIAILAGSLGLGLITLTTYPVVYGDEAYISSTAWGFVGGDAFRPAIAVGAGVFDDGFDLWAPKLGTSPFVLAELVGPTSLAWFRLVAWLIGLAAIGVFAYAVRALTGWRVAIAASAAFAASCGFYAASHYVRWDSLALVMTGLLLALLVRAPGPRRSLLIGALIGLSFDVSVSVAAATPAVVLLVGWEREGRGRRLALLAAGIAALGAVYYAHHVLPDPSLSERQYDAIYAPTYGLPGIEALEQGDLSPLLDESNRYDFMWQAVSASRGALLTMAAGLLAALALVASSTRSYPRAAVPGILLIGHLLGLALIMGNKTPIMAWYGLPYAIAAIAVAVAVLLQRRWRWFEELPPGRRRALMVVLGVLVVAPFAHLVHRFGLLTGDTSALWPLLLIAATAAVALLAARVGRGWSATEPAVVILLALALGASATTVADAYRTDQEPAATERLERAVRPLVRPGETVMGEWVYWWAFRDDRFKFNTQIWLSEYVHGESFEETFDRLCPDVVMLDDLWLARYVNIESGKIFPTQAPTDPTERADLRALLRRDYGLRGVVNVDQRKIEFWERRAGCGHV